MCAIKKVNIVDSIVDEMLNKIKEGKFKPGEKIPSERVLTQEFGVSRTSLREAFKKLELLGTITIRQGDGTYLNDSFQDNIIQNEIKKLFTVGNINVTEYLEAREHLEIKAAGLAAQRATQEDIENLSKIITELEQSIHNPETYQEKDFEFHTAIIRTAKNMIFNQFWSFLVPLITEQQRRSTDIAGMMKNAILGHKSILDAICSKNSKKAEKMMADHLAMIPGRLLSEVSRRINEEEKK